MRIRLEPDGQDNYKVVLPGENADYPIGLVWKDIFKKENWKIKAYFITSKRHDSILNKPYEDSMKAARNLADLFIRIENQRYVDFPDTYEFNWSDVSASD